jgi:hypothetical protein
LIGQLTVFYYNIPYKFILLVGSCVILFSKLIYRGSSAFKFIYICGLREITVTLLEWSVPVSRFFEFGRELFLIHIIQSILLLSCLIASESLGVGNH